MARFRAVQPSHGLWRGAIPSAPTTPQGRKENFFSDVVMRMQKKEEDEEKLGELLVDAAREGRVRVEPAASARATGEPRRPSSEDKYREMLRDIRAANPESDGWAKFKKRLAGRLTPRIARRWYLKSAAALAREDRQK